MNIVGRITVTCLMLLAIGVLQDIGIRLIRATPGAWTETGGLIVIGISWCVAVWISSVWERAAA